MFWSSSTGHIVLIRKPIEQFDLFPKSILDILVCGAAKHFSKLLDKVYGISSFGVISISNVCHLSPYVDVKITGHGSTIRVLQISLDESRIPYKPGFIDSHILLLELHLLIEALQPLPTQTRSNFNCETWLFKKKLHHTMQYLSGVPCPSMRVSSIANP